MGGQPDAAPQAGERSYAVVELRMLQNEIPRLTQFMVLCRAHVKQYQKRSDLVGARDTYSELQNTRNRLADALGNAQLLLIDNSLNNVTHLINQVHGERRGLTD